MEGIDSDVLALLPAYGREFDILDWMQGKDFQILGGPYCSIRDLPQIREDLGVNRLWFLTRRGEFAQEVSLTVQ